MSQIKINQTPFVHIIGLAVLVVLLSGFAPWTAKLGKDNPLVGKIYSEKEFISEDALNAKLSKANYVLLGEVHDNPDHHRLQALLLKKIVDSGKTPALVFEMLPRSAQIKVDKFLSSDDASPAGFGEAVGWKKRGWPDWEIYQPIMKVASDTKLKVIAGNVDRKMVREVARNGYSVLPSAKKWGLHKTMPENLNDVMDDILMAGHCNLLPQNALPAMRKVQRVRDAALADAMLTAGQQGAVLIAGAGHARADVGVPYYLNDRGARGAWLSVIFVPVSDDETNPQNYLEGHDQGTGTVYIFTPRTDDKDHCADLREHMKKKKKPDNG